MTVTEGCVRTSKQKQMSGSRRCTRVKQSQRLPGTRASREIQGNRPPGTKLEHGKMKMISAKEASQMKMKKKPSIWQGPQLHEPPASERNARRTGAQARAIMHDIKSSRGGYCPQGASKRERQRTRQEPRQSWTSDGTVVEHGDESSWNETSQADTAISETVPEMRFSRSRSW